MTEILNLIKDNLQILGYIAIVVVSMDWLLERLIHITKSWAMIAEYLANRHEYRRWREFYKDAGK